MPESSTRLYVELTRAFNEGMGKPQRRTSEDAAATRLEDFAGELARADAA